MRVLRTLRILLCCMVIFQLNGITQSVKAHPNASPPEPVDFIKPDWVGPEPDWTDFADKNYTIYWRDYDSDSNAQITLFYDDDQNLDNGHLGIITEGLQEDWDENRKDYVWNTGVIPEGEYQWNTTAVSDGEYYIGAIISDETSSRTSYSTGRVRVFHFPRITKPSANAGLTSIWSAPEIDNHNPYLVNRQVFFTWEQLEPCGDNTFMWKINPVSGGYYVDYNADGVCDATEMRENNHFKELFMEELYKKVDGQFKQPLELIHPEAKLYVYIKGPSVNTLRRNLDTGKYEKRNFWLFDEVALLRTPDGDYNANGRGYPSVQFWAPNYKQQYQELLEEFAAEVKTYEEIYPYIEFIRVQFNAFNEEMVAPSSASKLCDYFDSVEACVDYAFRYENYDPETRYEVNLAKTPYLDTTNEQRYYYQEGVEYHKWLIQTYYSIFQAHPDGKLRVHLGIKPFPMDEGYITPQQIINGFLYEMIHDYGVWLYETNVLATGHVQNSNMTRIIRDEKITRGYTEPFFYADSTEAGSIIPDQYDNLLQWIYWHILLDLHRGIDMISFYGNIIEKCESGGESYCDFFGFLNRYAGQNFSPASSPGAWIAFRPLFFPEMLSGNLGLFITQLDPDGTSNRLFGYDTCAGSGCQVRVDLNPPNPAYWDCAYRYCPEDGYFGADRNGKVIDLGPKDQPYGIWARSIGANGKNSITLDLNDEFVSAFCADQFIEINIIYLDRGSDSFTLKYKSRTGQGKKIVIKKGDSGYWKGDQETEAIVTNDFLFDNSLQGGDIQLLSDENGEDIFHMLEVKKIGGCGAYDDYHIVLPFVSR